MAPSVASAAVPSHRHSLEAVTPAMAKADLKKVETPDWKADVGRAIDRAIALANKTQKEVWVALAHADGAQLNRWLAGKERPQFDALFAIDWLRQPLVVALAGLAGDDVEIVTEIRMRRSA